MADLYTMCPVIAEYSATSSCSKSRLKPATVTLLVDQPVGIAICYTATLMALVHAIGVRFRDAVSNPQGLPARPLAKPRAMRLRWACRENDKVPLNYCV